MARERARFEVPGLEERLDEAFRRKGLSKSELARRCGYESYVVGRIMAGVLPESFERFKRVAEALDVTWQWLLAGETSEAAAPKSRPAGGGPGGGDGPRDLRRPKRRRPA